MGTLVACGDTREHGDTCSVWRHTAGLGTCGVAVVGTCVVCGHTGGHWGGHQGDTRGMWGHRGWSPRVHRDTCGMWGHMTRLGTWGVATAGPWGHNRGHIGVGTPAWRRGTWWGHSEAGTGDTEATPQGHAGDTQPGGREVTRTRVGAETSRGSGGGGGGTPPGDTGEDTRGPRGARGHPKGTHGAGACGPGPGPGRGQVRPVGAGPSPGHPPPASPPRPPGPRRD